MALTLIEMSADPEDGTLKLRGVLRTTDVLNGRPCLLDLVLYDHQGLGLAQVVVHPGDVDHHAGHFGVIVAERALSGPPRRAASSQARSRSSCASSS